MDFLDIKTPFIGLLLGLLEDSEEHLLFLILSLFFGVNPALRTFLVTMDLRDFC